MWTNPTLDPNESKPNAVPRGPIVLAALAPPAVAVHLAQHVGDGLKDIPNNSKLSYQPRAKYPKMLTFVW